MRLRALFCLVAVGAAAQAAAEVPFHRAGFVFPLEHWHNHSSSIVELPSGELLVCWYHGSGERTADDVKVEGARLAPGATRWSGRFTLADTPGFPDTNPAMFVDSRRRLWLLWPVIVANEWHTALMKYRISSRFEGPGEPAWEHSDNILIVPRNFAVRVREVVEPWLKLAAPGSQAERYAKEVIQKASDKYFSRMGWMTRAHPTELPSGRILVPLYSDGYSFSLVAITDDGGRTWTSSEPIVGPGSIQPSLVRRRDGSIAAYMRDNGPPPKRVLISESRDEGVTWTPAADSDIPNPGAGMEVIALRDGNWAMIYNDTERGRHSLAVALSDDEGKSWKWKRHLELDTRETGAGSFHYPSMIQARDGTLHASYSYFLNHLPPGAARKTIKHAHFNVAWVKQGDPPAKTEAAPAGMRVFNDDGGWCWFQDERVLVTGGRLIVGSVAAGARDAARRGNIEVVSYDLASGARERTVLHQGLLNTPGGAYDDHNAPAFVERSDGRLLAVYAAHGTQNRFYYRISERPRDATTWRDEKVFVPSETSRITYQNLHRLSKENGGKGRIYNFYRGYDNSFKPSYAYSDDDGETWRPGGVFIDVPGAFRHRPYVRYASDGVGTVHMFYTEGHPRDFDNSVYHVFYRAGNLHRSDGSVIRPLAEGLRKPEEGTRIFRGDPDNVAWTSDIHADAQGRPWVAYSVQKNSAGLPSKQGGEDHRYRYARWTGKEWRDYEIAFAGSRLYPGEDDYTGNIALDPDDPDAVYISTNADPVTGARLPRYQIFAGRTADGGRSWRWTPLTGDSDADNIRPMLPKWDKANTAVLWLRGTYRAYTNYDLAVVGLIRR